MSTSTLSVPSGFTLADTLPTPGFFTAAIATDESHNFFESSFRDGNACSDRNQDSLPVGSHNDSSFRDAASGSFLDSAADSPFSPMFGFSSGGASPASIDLVGDRGETREQQQQQQQEQEDAAVDFTPSSMWRDSRQERQEKHMNVYKNLFGHSQEPSPPQSSSSHSPKSWIYGDLQSTTSLAPLHQLLTRHSTMETRSVHGQITPPTRESPNPVLAGGAFNYSSTLIDAQESATQVESQHSTPQGAGKRKRSNNSSLTTETTEYPKKERRRRPSTKLTTTPETQSAEADDDVKRSRFLERNRLAASKCRQKKKEWTKGLEEKARSLQTEKLQLQMMVGSLKSEMIYVREELLKHGNCGCKRIRDYLNTEVNALAQNQGQLTYLMRDIPSRHCSMTPSTNGSRKDSLGSRQDSTSLSSNTDTKSNDSYPSMHGSKAGEDLHAMLVAQLGSDSEEEGLME
ncbi:MAG: hypothetical protein M1840_005013 [Geoglossum simile]|nr:MAG: hypothetical protein M1840_005013 [Geoglossum simile]